MKINVAVIFGGKSVEHEISIITALQAIRYMDKEKYNIIPVYITKDNKMYTGKDIGTIESYRNIDTLLKNSRQVILTNLNGRAVIVNLPFTRKSEKTSTPIDVVFPAVHGTNVEDGALQGFLKTLGVPFVGCDVLSSAVGMDKHVMKLVFRDAGIPVLDCSCFLKTEFFDNENAVIERIENSYPYPVIIKPVNLGSSVGISKANTRDELVEALDLAFQFAPKVLVEKAITSLREINCSVVGDIYEAEASECEEPLNATDILSFDDKYLGGSKSKGGSKGMASLSRQIPADLTSETREYIRSLAVKAFQALGCSGVSRIDFMIDTSDNSVYLNEINTIPGSLSFYLWEPVGVSYRELIDRLIRLSLKRSREEGDIVYSFDSNVLANCSFDGAKSSKTGKLN